MAIRNVDKTVAATGRRQFLLTASLAGAALGAEPAAAMPAETYGEGTATYVIDDTSAIGETESGKVTGYIRNNIRIFKGIPYAEILSPEGGPRLAPGPASVAPAPPGLSARRGEPSSPTL
jgi:hypothetical protein